MDTEILTPKEVIESSSRPNGADGGCFQVNFEQGLLPLVNLGSILGTPYDPLCPSRRDPRVQNQE